MKISVAEEQKILERYEKDYDGMSNYWDDLHKRHRNCTKFTWFNEQWDDEAKAARAVSGGRDSLPPRPTLVFNISKPFIIKVINGVKKMKPALKVKPMDDTDVELADVRRGIMRGIEKNTGAIPARLNALKDAVNSGYGFYRFDTDYADPRSFDQEIKYHIIEDPTTVYWDENSVEPDGSDCMKCRIEEKYSKKRFESEFGIKWDEVYTQETSSAWGSMDSPVVAEYWYIEEKEETLVRVIGENGYEEAFLSEVKKEYGDDFEPYLELDEDGEYIQRPTTSRQVYRCKMAGKKVLDIEKWKGYWIPIFKIVGRKSTCENKVRIDGLGEDVKAPQKAYNYARNGKLERMALSPKNPFLTATGSVPKSAKYKWETANTRNWSSLDYNAYDDQQRPLPAPIRANPVNIDPGLVQEEVTAAEEIKATLGMFGSYMGDTAGEKSGRAIQAGAAESADITYDFAHNMAITMNHEGRVLNELIPKIYDTARQVRMVGEDDEEKVITVNQQAQDERGRDYYYDMNQGKFDVSVTMGPDSETKRMQQREEMEALFGKTPELREVLSPEFIRVSDWDGADEIADIAKAFREMKYPTLKIPDKNAKNEVNPQVMQMQQQMQEMNGILQQLQAENEQLKTDKSLEAQKLQNDDMNNEEKNEIDTYKADTDRFKAETDAQVQAEKLRNERIKLKIEADKLVNDYKLEVMKLESQREERLAQPSPDINETNEKYETSMKELNEKYDSKIAELQAREPVINVNVENILPEKKNVTVSPLEGGGYSIINE